MSIHTVKLRQEFDAPVEQVWAALNDHENFGKIMGQKIRRIVDSTDPQNPNGVGSVRFIDMPMMPFEETVRKSESGRSIEYQITKGTPLNYHLGKMVFTKISDRKCALDYTIDVGSKTPLLGWLVKMILQNGIAAALKKYANSLKSD